ncbi:FAD-dependent monooxygenase [Tsukamurella pseudospumae]|uniref:Salicylate hydroxylase n=1 Tax=Tsukamurella pseudospumae TaxID=239498 RepID=A0A138AUA6_9ACTN|nr:FAD-dependent monooxygenase [Tsukamurella pseudospumae]KXP14012.1 salicylate hydroxylase [Tsukamurella pseudospumae]
MGASTVAVVGGGIGGLTAAIALRAQGIDVVVHEQASRFARVGADINLTPNAVRALDGLGGGLGERLRENAARPRYRISRTWDTGVETSRIAMGEDAEIRYGAPQLTLHRGDLISALEDRLPAATVRFGSRIESVDPGGATDSDGAVLRFADGSSEEADLVIGADGIHSRVRTAMFGAERPTFTGVVAFRSVVPASRLTGVPNLDSFTKWWGPDRSTQIVTFPLTRGEEIFVFATVGQEEWTEESWTTPGSVDELRALYEGFHPEARALLEGCDETLKSALYVRDPLSEWSAGRAVLLGDACHPMMPFMAQGAGQAIEDAVVLSRMLAAHAGAADAVRAYEAERRPRTARIQIGSRGNDWLKSEGSGDWVYGYDAWSVPTTVPGTVA